MKYVHLSIHHPTRSVFVHRNELAHPDTPERLVDWAHRASANRNRPVKAFARTTQPHEWTRDTIASFDDEYQAARFKSDLLVLYRDYGYKVLNERY
jgi:hypothetical protein